MPNIREISTILLPITLPKLKLEFPTKAELMPTNNSGNVVARAKIIKLAENSLILKKTDNLITLSSTHKLLLVNTKAITIKNIKSITKLISASFNKKVKL